MSDSSAYKLDFAEVWDEVRKHYPAVLTFFRARLPRHRSHDAQDLAHDTVIAATETLVRSGRAAVEDLASYVLGVARHKFNDALRAGYRRDRRATSDENELVRAIESRFAETAAEQQLIEEERHRALRAALDTLAPREREFLRLRYIEGLDHESACRKLGITPAAGSRLKYKALERLRERIARETGGEATH